MMNPNMSRSQQHQSKIKRKQVKQACVNCRKRHIACDETRPCKQCVKQGTTDTCKDVPRKRRKTNDSGSVENDMSEVQHQFSNNGNTMQTIPYYISNENYPPTPGNNPHFSKNMNLSSPNDNLPYLFTKHSYIINTLLYFISEGKNENSHNNGETSNKSETNDENIESLKKGIDLNNSPSNDSMPEEEENINNLQQETILLSRDTLTQIASVSMEVKTVIDRLLSKIHTLETAIQQEELKLIYYFDLYNQSSTTPRNDQNSPPKLSNEDEEKSN